jgi:hypothetical protein
LAILALLSVLGFGIWTFLPSSTKTKIFIRLKLKASNDVGQTTPFVKEKKLIQPKIKQPKNKSTQKKN